MRFSRSIAAVVGASLAMVPLASAQETPEATVRKAWDALRKMDAKALAPCLDGTPDEIAVATAFVEAIKASREFKAAFVERFGEAAWTGEAGNRFPVFEIPPLKDVRVTEADGRATAFLRFGTEADAPRGDGPKIDGDLNLPLVRKDGSWKIALRDNLGLREGDGYGGSIKELNDHAATCRKAAAMARQPDATAPEVLAAAGARKEPEPGAPLDLPPEFDLRKHPALDAGRRLAMAVLDAPVRRAERRILRASRRNPADIKGQDTPRAAFRKMAEAFNKLDRDAFFECLAGGANDLIVRDAEMELIETWLELKDAYTARFGEKAWEDFVKAEGEAMVPGRDVARDARLGALVSPEEFAKIDAMEITVKGDEAESPHEWLWKPTRFARTGGVWRVVVPESPEREQKPRPEFAADDPERCAVAVFYHFARAGHNLASKIRWGVCRTPEDVKKTLDYEVMKAQGKAVADVVLHGLGAGMEEDQPRVPADPRK